MSENEIAPIGGAEEASASTSGGLAAVTPALLGGRAPRSVLKQAVALSSPDDDYFTKLTSTLEKPVKITKLSDRPDEFMFQKAAVSMQRAPNGAAGAGSTKKQIELLPDGNEKESLLDGFILLRLSQLLNLDIYYIGAYDKTPGLGGTSSGGSKKSESREQLTLDDETSEVPNDLTASENPLQVAGDAPRGLRRSKLTHELIDDRPNLLDELADMNPLHGPIRRNRPLASLSRLLKISLSLIAIMISVDKTLSTILLCLLSRPDIRKSALDDVSNTYESSDVSMSWFVLVLVNISSTYILFATVFNGHLVWRLLAQRMFFVSRRFQYKTMLLMLIFVYIEYILNIAFINNLFGWSFEAETDQLSSIGSPTQMAATSRPNQAAADKGPAAYTIHNSYSVLSSLEIFVTDKNERNPLVDILLTIFQFARGIIRMSPFVTVSYSIICLTEHVKAIRYQTLLIDGLKRRQKLRMVVMGKRPAVQSAKSTLKTIVLQAEAEAQKPRKKRVAFKTADSQQQQQENSEPAGQFDQLSVATLTRQSTQDIEAIIELPPPPQQQQQQQQLRLTNSSTSSLKSALSQATSRASAYYQNDPERRLDEPHAGRMRTDRRKYLDCIRDFDELEAAVTNMYIFTDRLNRLMSRQGLAVFYIVHNLVVTCALIVPEAIRGGPPMAGAVRVLVIGLALVPFIVGHSFENQLDELAKQLDRIIIYQHFTGRKRDNLVRIRDLLHDIRITCGGMLEFKLETGIKYLVLAFASAFFIEQEHYKLTRRH